jgi:hypothetical protein
VIDSLSGNVPWWGAVLIAVIAAIGGPVAVLIQNRHHDVSKKGDLRHAAYERLIAASEIVAARATNYGSQRSVPYTFSRTGLELVKAVTVFALGYSALKDRPKFLQIVSDAIPTPTPLVDSVDANSIQTAFEELIKANISVNLYGTNRAIAAGEKLLDDAKSFFLLIQSGGWTWSGLPAKNLLGESRDKMTASTSAFVMIARDELKLRDNERSRW